jgi:hypothetical protein
MSSGSTINNMYYMLQTFLHQKPIRYSPEARIFRFQYLRVEAPERPGFGKIHHNTSIRIIVLTTSQIPGTGNISSRDAFLFCTFLHVALGVLIVSCVLSQCLIIWVS